ncbi:MAG TPA: hypothetical protein VHO48_14340 [Anaerolineaceae bacterium]|nr:hypothetical protein [Anaerolineaceae bacterium]
MKETVALTALQLASFGLLYVLSRTAFSDVYVLDWTAHNYYLYLWIPVILLSIFQKTILSLSLTIGNLFGILLGQILGDMIRLSNMQKITEMMTEGQKYQLLSHPGVFIWIFTILGFLALGEIASLIHQRKVRAVISNNAMPI